MCPASSGAASRHVSGDGPGCGFGMEGSNPREGRSCVLQQPLRQLAEGVRNGAASVEGDRSVAHGFPAESVTDRDCSSKCDTEMPTREIAP